MLLEWEMNSGKFQNNAINDVKKISLSHVIKWKTNLCHQIFQIISKKWTGKFIPNFPHKHVITSAYLC